MMSAIGSWIYRVIPIPPTLALIACSPSIEDEKFRSACMAVRAGGTDVLIYGYPLSVYLDGLRSRGAELKWTSSTDGGILRVNRHDPLTDKYTQLSFEMTETTARNPSDSCGPAQMVFTRVADGEGNVVDGFNLQALIVGSAKSFAEAQHIPAPTFQNTTKTDTPGKSDGDKLNVDAPNSTNVVPQEQAPENDKSAPDNGGPSTPPVSRFSSKPQDAALRPETTVSTEQEQQTQREDRARDEANCRKDYEKVYAIYIENTNVETGSAVTAEQVRMNACLKNLGPR